MNLDPDVKAVGTLRDGHGAAFNSNDAGPLAAYCTKNTVLLLPNQADDVTKPKHIPLEIQAAGDWGYARGNITGNLTPKSGKPIEKSINYLAILKWGPDGSWKGYRDMANSGLNS